MNQTDILTYLQKQYPNNEVKLIGSGWSSDAFEVGDKIIRIPKTDVKPYEKEIAVLEFLQNKLPVQIPHPHLVKGRYPYAEHKKINGESWNIETYNKLSATDKNLFAKDIAHFFAVLHAIPATEILKAIPKKMIAGYTLQPVTKFHDYLKPYFSVQEIDTVYNWASKIEQISKNPVLIHNDFWKANVLVDKKHRLTGVFDWANACLSNPEWDFKALYSPNYFPLLDKILDFYQQETGRKISKKQIAKEKLADCLFNVQYFGENPKLQITMSNQWKETLMAVKKALAAIQSENLNLNKQNIKKIER